MDAAIFKALASLSKLLDRQHDEAGQTFTQLCGGLDMSRQAVTKHLVILEDANLVATQRGYEMRHDLNPVPINAIAAR